MGLQPFGLVKKVKNSGAVGNRTLLVTYLFYDSNKNNNPELKYFTDIKCAYVYLFAYSFVN